MIVLDMSIFPLDKGQSLSRYVARCVDIVDRSGLDYRCHAMGTTIEGEFDELMDVVRQCFQALAADCDRVICSIKFDYRKGRTKGIESKVQSVEAQLGRPVRKQ